MIEDFYNHTCDIYHIKKEEVDKGFGIIDDKVYSYEKEPDIADVPCHFYIKTLEQFSYSDPRPLVTGRMKLALGTDVDIRMNDKVVNKVTGLEYIAEVVHNIQGHHLMVYLFRDKEYQT